MSQPVDPISVKVLLPIPAMEVLLQLRAEIQCGSRYMVVGKPLHALDFEHIAKAEMLIDLLISSQR